MEERGGASADGGVDVVLRRDGQTTLVQCKRWRDYKVGVQQVRELLGAMTHERAGAGILVTAGRFTDDAFSLARQNRIQLVDGPALVEMIQSVRRSADPVALPESKP